MTRAEGVVAINVGQSRQCFGELGVPFLLASVEPHVFEDEQRTRRQSAALGPRVVAHRVGRKGHGPPQQLGEPVGRRLEAVFGLGTDTFRTAEVADQN